MIFTVRAVLAVVASVGLLPAISQFRAGEPIANQSPSVRIGVAESLCRDADPPVMLVSIPPFRALAKSCTGLDCEVADGGDAFHLAARLAQGQFDLGIFQGIEFAWVQQKYPELLPLVTVVNGKPYLRAYLVVPTSRHITALSDLGSKSLAVPRYSLDDCYEFLCRLCREQGLSPERFLSQVVRPPNVEEALDAVAEGTLSGAIVEEISLECYCRQKPGRFKRLQIVRRSERFPASVIAYRAGRLSGATLRAFRDGICNADRNPLSRDLLTWWRISAFEEVPADYQQTLAAIVKVYPTASGAFQMITWRSLLSQTDQFLRRIPLGNGGSHYQARPAPSSAAEPAR